MKRILSILSAGVIAFLAASCAQEPLATFDPAKGTAPVLGTVEVGAKNVSVSYTPGEFKLGFNDKIAPTHSLALVGVDGKAVSKLISSKNDGSTLSATLVNISRALQFFGYADGDQVGSLDIVVRASIQDPSRDNGRNGYLDSDKYTISGFTVTLPQGSPYQDYTQASTWSVIGALSNYEISWDGDLPMTTNGKTFVAQGIKISKDDQFKFRKDAGWDTNFGAPGDVEPFVVNLGSESPAAAGGKNLAVPEDGIYDLILDPDGQTFTVVETLGGGVSGKIGGNEPGPGPVVVTGWNVIGANGDWDNDIIASEKDGVWTAYINAPEATNFKWRKDAGWDENYGGVMTAVGEAFEAVPGGDNINVEAGEYIVTFDPAAKTITVDAAMPSNTWSVIGVNGDWDNDHFMTEVAPGIWVSEMLSVESEGWKVRFNHGWDVNRGGATPEAVGQFVEGIPGGDNINLTGNFKVVYNALNGTVGTLGYGVTGSIAARPEINWNNDIPMHFAADGKWYSVPVPLAEGDQIKIRFGGDWAENFGGACAGADEAFEAVAGGDNISAPAEGTYMVVYDPEAGTITLSTNYWGLIGVNGDWDNDHFMYYDGEGKWIAYHKDISGGWKIRKNAKWDVNFGGAYAAAGEPFEGVPGGDNIAVGDLTNFSVVFDEAAGTITVNK